MRDTYAHDYLNGVCTGCGKPIQNFQGVTADYPGFNSETVIVNKQYLSVWMCDHCVRPPVLKGAFTAVLLCFIGLAAVLAIIYTTVRMK